MAVFRKRTHTPTPKKKDIPAGLWTKCPLDGEMVYTKDLEANWNVFPISGYHERLSTRRRIALLIDEGTWKETECPSGLQGPAQVHRRRFLPGARRPAPEEVGSP